MTIFIYELDVINICNMADWSAWFRVAGSHRFPLHNFLQINNNQKLLHLQKSNLPHSDKDQDIRFKGNIISNKENTIIEMMPHLAEQSSMSKIFHGKVNCVGRLEFEEKAPIQMIQDANKVIRKIKTARNSLMSGYFEFQISNNNNITFLDYKKPLR